ncbi:hypothetical protein ASPSYDRAFT_660741 [Aspergillus sydowii CBS 593.65]|uniref:MADS-box domain-containing protein n=1 Tax=Aspergillus sydowii CBS 593.65 TaxID=1036612 RepID=A0A1L9TTC4_9EURO|nr:uncharacterized protein ASPSYDRAFT_660741 [Aspergillus sydowii CBS 593.65]OJJ62710.1 hypothetical protein ASPSYDRAFT_660741 [Aspergillus sydowii CBS 593.65]
MMKQTRLSLSNFDYAASQQKHRRKNTIYKRAAEYSLECKADTLVAIQIRKTGEIYVFDSTGGRWLGALSRLDGCYPRPIPVTMEDIIPGI